MRNIQEKLTQGNIVLLLGAGASRPLGLPTMADFWPIIYDDPFLNRTKTALDKLKEVYRNQSDSNKPPDLEAILDLIETYHKYYDIMFNDPIFKWDINNKTMKKYWLFRSEEPKNWIIYNHILKMILSYG